MASTQLGSAGWLLLLAAIVFGLTRLLRADMLNSLLAKFGIPSIPAKAIPWVAIVLGFLGGMIQAKSGGQTWGDSALMGLWGILSGTLAIGGHEALEAPVRATLGQKVGNVFFGKRALPIVPPSERVKRSNPPPPPAAGLSTLTLGAFLALFGAITVLPGCAAFAAAIPVITEVVTYVSDAQQILSAIQIISQTFFAEHPNPDLQKKLAQDLSEAHLALDTIVQIGQGAKDLSDKDLVDAIAKFQKVYTDIDAILKQTGLVPPAGTLRATAPGGPARIPTPMLMTLKVKKS